jgi:glucosylglycerate phosphorylase
MPSQTNIYEAIHSKLLRIYGERAAQSAYEKLCEIVADFDSKQNNNLAISEKDVMLICYGDHLQDQQRPHLQVLHQFLKETIYPTVNSVHILPFFPYSSDDGFSVIDYYAVDPNLGAWEHIDAMKDDFRLMFDAVFNHISAKSEWFQKYKQGESPYEQFFIEVDPDTDLSLVARPRALPLLTAVETVSGTKHVWTTFSNDQIDLNFANPDLLLETIRVLLFYVAHGAEFIRLDAIAFIWKKIGTDSIHLEETHLIIQLMRDVLNLVAADTVLITETNVPHQENISYFGDGYNEAQLVYQFPLPPLILHTLTAGDSTHLTQWAQSLKPASDRTTFFNFTASHDGIGLRPTTGLLTQKEIDALVQLTEEHGGYVSYKSNGDGSNSAYELNITYFDAITNPSLTEENPQLAVERFIVSQAIMLSFAGVPGIYLHNLFGSRNWYEGVEESQRFRTINREKLLIDALQKELRQEGSIRNRVFSRYMDLLKIRTTEKAFHPLGKQTILTISPSIFAIQRQSLDKLDYIMAVHNVTDQIVRCDLPIVGMWRDLHSDLVWDGSNQINLQPYQICWLKRDA